MVAKVGVVRVVQLTQTVLRMMVTYRRAATSLMNLVILLRSVTAQSKFV